MVLLILLFGQIKVPVEVIAAHAIILTVLLLLWLVVIRIVAITLLTGLVSLHLGLGAARGVASGGGTVRIGEAVIIGFNGVHSLQPRALSCLECCCLCSIDLLLSPDPIRRLTPGLERKFPCELVVIVFDLTTLGIGGLCRKL